MGNGNEAPFNDLVVVFLAASAKACIDIQPFRIEGIKDAEAIFIGQPFNFQRIPPLGFLEVRVHSTLKGRPPKIVRLVWGSNFGIPDHLDLPSEVIIAASRVPDDSYYGEDLEKGGDRFERSALFHLEGSACSAEYILDHTPQNVANIRMIIRGQQVTPHNYRRAINLMAERGYKRRAEAERARRERIRIGVIACGVLTLILSVSLLLRRKRLGRF